MHAPGPTLTSVTQVRGRTPFVTCREYPVQEYYTARSGHGPGSPTLNPWGEAGAGNTKDGEQGVADRGANQATLHFDRFPEAIRQSHICHT